MRTEGCLFLIGREKSEIDRERERARARTHKNFCVCVCVFGMRKVMRMVSVSTSVAGASTPLRTHARTHARAHTHTHTYSQGSRMEGGEEDRTRRKGVEETGEGGKVWNVEERVPISPLPSWVSDLVSGDKTIKSQIYRKEHERAGGF